MTAREHLEDVIDHVKSELTDRRRFEAEMERRLGKIWDAQRREVMRLLGDPPNINNVPESYWNNGGKAIRKAISSVLEDVYLAQSLALAEQVNLQVDWMMVNQNAINWASRYAMQLSSDLNKRTRDMVTELVQGYFQNGWTIDELAERIARFYDPIRARTVAITETTNAAVQSQIQTANDISRIYGVQFKEVWRVSEYDRVCEVCSPKDGKLTSEVGYPPEHINCACYVEYTIE